MWQLIDHSNGKTQGYLRIMLDGKRVADLFPYAPDTDSQWLIETGHHIVDVMNKHDMRRPKVHCTECDCQNPPDGCNWIGPPRR